MCFFSVLLACIYVCKYIDKYLKKGYDCDEQTRKVTNPIHIVGARHQMRTKNTDQQIYAVSGERLNKGFEFFVKQTFLFQM